MRSPLLDRFETLARRPEPGQPALEDEQTSRSFTGIYERAGLAARVLVGEDPFLAGRRVAILLTPGTGWLEAFLGVIRAGGIAVPLSPQYPPSELAWFGADSGADTVLVSAELEGKASQLMAGRRVLRPADLEAGAAAPFDGPDPAAEDTALLLYTSGTTGKPKGARITHGNVAHQAELLREAWGLSDRDVLLHALPLHHLHGLGISLLNTVLAGAGARMLPRFDASRVWEELAAGKPTVWMAVPTMYQKLFEAFDAASDETRARWAGGARRLRLATSGSAALPVTLAARWKAITGSIPLERFGMTEIGVGMSNLLDPEMRRPGWVGPPLRTVETRIIDEAGQDLERGPGELLIRGPSVFPGYWNRDDSTRAAFTDDWFRTGDVAERSEDGHLKLLGRTSIDILKSGGYKLSALEIEEALREHPAVAEVAVVGLPDETWGQRVTAVVVPTSGREDECEGDALRVWARERLASYKIPRQVVVATSLPRNALGKVVKPELERALLAGQLK